MKSNLPANPTASLYQTDLHAWARTNAALLRERRFSELDLENLIEEVDDMGKSEQRSIYSHLMNLVMHLLKWQHQPTFRSKSWSATIVNARLAILRLVKQNPSLRDAPRDDLADAYRDAVKLAATETGLLERDFPETCPFSIAEILNESWMPD